MKHARRMMVCQIGRGSSPPPDLLIDDCEVAWTAPTGLLRTIGAAPTAGGTGYTVGDILTLTESAGGQVRVTSVSSGVVTGVELYAGGLGGYTTGTGKATSGGTGTGCTVNVTAVVSGTATRSSTQAHDGTYSIRPSMTSDTPPIRSMFAYRAISPGSLSAYSKLKVWAYLPATGPTDGEWLVCLCSDTVGRVVVDTFTLPWPVVITTWTEFVLARASGGKLGANIQSIALYRSGVAHTGGILQPYLDTFSVSA